MREEFMTQLKIDAWFLQVCGAVIVALRDHTLTV